jgi:hypothetical protein
MERRGKQFQMMITFGRKWFHITLRPLCEECIFVVGRATTKVIHGIVGGRRFHTFTLLFVLLSPLFRGLINQFDGL